MQLTSGRAGPAPARRRGGRSRSRAIEGAVGGCQRRLGRCGPPGLARAGARPAVRAVAHVQEAAVGGHLGQPRPTAHGALEERRVLGEPAQRVAHPLLPQPPRKHERAAAGVVREQAAMQLGARRPEAPGLEIEGERPAQGADVRLAGQQRLELRGQPVGTVPVVVVPLGDDRAPRGRAPAVALGSYALAALQAQVPDAVIGRQPARQLRRAVVDDHELAMRVVLALEVPDGL